MIAFLPKIFDCVEGVSAKAHLNDMSFTMIYYRKIDNNTRHSYSERGSRLINVNVAI